MTLTSVINPTTETHYTNTCQPPLICELNPDKNLSHRPRYSWENDIDQNVEKTY